jgi:predicted porin
MKRNLLALAVAGAFLAPAAAIADGSGIVLTGVIHGDVGFGYEKADGGGVVYKRQANIGTFATRWEIDGTEDLGWAKAIFGLAMDQKFAGAGAGSSTSTGGGGQNNNNNNIGDLNNRNSFLGLTGGFGTVKIGQNEHQYEIQQILQDPDPASENTFSTLSLMTNYGVNVDDDGLVGGPPGFTRRDPQSIWYTSPNFGGITVDLVYVTPAGRKNNSVSPSGIQGAVMWKSAFGLSVYGALAQYTDENTAFSDDNKNTGLRFGVGYGTSLFQVDAAIEQLKFKANEGAFSIAGNSSDTLKRTNFMVSGALNLGQHHIRGAVNLAQKAKLGGTISDSSARMILVGYAYTLSPRTEFQVNYGMVDNKKNSCFNVQSCGNDANRFGVGIRHTF